MQLLNAITRLLSPRAESIQDLDLRSPKGWPAGEETFSGEHVNAQAVLRLSAAWACGRLISETGATLPCGVFRKRADGTKELADDDQLYYLLHVQPNANMSAMVFWQVAWLALLFWGNAFAEIRRSGRTITSIEFLPTPSVSWEERNGTIRWWFTDTNGRRREIPATSMWHIPGLTADGRFGLSPIRYGANVFGNARAASRASGDTFRNGMKSPGLVTMDAKLRGEQRDELRGHIANVASQGGIMVLEKGSAFSALTMNPQDAELLATQRFSVEEICRWFGVPPFMVGHGEKTTTWGTGIEQQMIGFVTFVMRPWCVRIEQSIRLALIPPERRRDLSAEFNLEGLLRGDSAARQAFYSAMVNNGIMTRDECRVKENLPPKGGNAGELMVHSAMAPIDSLGAPEDGDRARAALQSWLDQSG